MAEKQKSNAPSSKAMDVAKPGKSTPSASSRPIIVGNKQTVQDPMVNDKQATQSGEQTIAVRRSAPQVIAPLSETEKLAAEGKADTTAEPSETEQNAAQAEPPAPTEGAVVDEEQSAESAASTSDSGGSSSSGSSKDSGGKSSSIVDAVVDQASKNKDKKDDKKQAELEKRQAEIEKLIEEKKYYVPTAQVTKKQRKTRWAALLLVILLLIGAYVAIDAQVIKNNIQLPYEFFKEERQATSPLAPAQSVKKDDQQEKSSDEKAEQADDQSQESMDGQLPAQVSGRDMDRKNELKNLQQKLETYFNDNGVYPTGADWKVAINATNDEVTGPRGDVYSYESNDGTSYTLKAQLENANDPDAIDGSYVINSVNE